MKRFPEKHNLRDYIEHNRKQTMHETLQLMIPVIKNLEHMHKDKIIHGEISPDNLEVHSDGSLELHGPDKEERWCDITLTRLVDNSNYSAPERLDSKGISGSWSDVYSLCAVMYFCLTGEDPINPVSRMLLDDLKKPSEMGADIRPSEEETLMRGLMLDSNNRIHDMIQLQQSFMIQ